MSIMRTLKKIVDPIAAKAEEAELRGRREEPQTNTDGKRVAYKCRVCAHRSRNGEYCPECLADTMVAEQDGVTK